MRTLAAALYYQNKYSQAERAARHALEGLERQLGFEHNDTRLAANILGVVLRGMPGGTGEAEVLARRVLAARMVINGETHLNTCASMSNLAGLLTDEQKDLVALTGQIK